MDGLFVLEWSHEKNCFRVVQLANLLKMNREFYLNNYDATNRYRAIHVGSQHECEALARNCAGTLKARERAKNAVEA